MTGTRSQFRADASPTCHVLDFFYDNDNGSALTVLVKDSRHHIIVDYDQLTASVKQEYLPLLQAVRKQDGVSESQQTSRKRKRSEDVSEQESTDSGYGSSPLGPDAEEKPPGSEKPEEAQGEDHEDADTNLHNWILQFLGDTFAKLEPAEKERTRTVHDWFHEPTHFYNLTVSKDDHVLPEELEATEEMQDRMDNLVPLLKLPKYILQHDIPMFDTSDLEVLETSDMPSPLHPAIVRSKSDGNTYFLKLVDRSQPGPTKRELKIMKEIEDKGLHKKIRVPLVKGLVRDIENTKTSIIGFLQTHIASPTPLTLMLDTDVAEEKRETWASESARMIRILHENGIVWGDCKADNFMVDEAARLWIIDFGGSYTDGWVDPDLAETKEGDDMGIEKVVNALRDPEAATFDPEEKEEEEGEEEEEEEEEDHHKEKKVRFDEKTYCYCKQGSYGKMIGCDSQDCPMQWFHMECTGLEQEPADNESWFCDECQGSGQSKIGLRAAQTMSRNVESFFL